MLGIVVDGVDALVGLTCDPITAIGVGGGQWYVLPISSMLERPEYQQLRAALRMSSAARTTASVCMIFCVSMMDNVDFSFTQAASSPLVVSLSSSKRFSALPQRLQDNSMGHKAVPWLTYALWSWNVSGISM